MTHNSVTEEPWNNQQTKLTWRWEITDSCKRQAKSWRPQLYRWWQGINACDKVTNNTGHGMDQQEIGKKKLSYDRTNASILTETMWSSSGAAVQLHVYFFSLELQKKIELQFDFPTDSNTFARWNNFDFKRVFFVIKWWKCELFSPWKWWKLIKFQTVFFKIWLRPQKTIHT